SPIPPVSYAIGVWEPQRLVWQAIMLFHFPARALMGYFRRSFTIKIILFPISFFASLSTAASYPYATTHCSTPAYISFCICEYIIVAINSFYYSMVVYEFHSEWVE
ncbi:hypothetical protein PFISCL1PPCAC_6296, partial [Pristionchus fissidentatus]